MDGVDDIVEEFLAESHENLDQLDSDLVALGQDPGSPERLSSMFRTLRAIRRTSGFLAFHRLENVAHVGEDMLSRLRDGELDLTPARTGVLLQTVDAVRSLLGSIEACGSEGPVDVCRVVAAISAATEDDPEPIVPGPVPATPLPTRPVDDPPGGAPAAPESAEQSDTGQSDTGVADGQPRSGVTDSTIREDVELLDQLALLVGELALTRDRIGQVVARRTDSDLIRYSQQLDLVVGELQDSVMRTRMQPMDHLSSELPPLALDTVEDPRTPGTPISRTPATVPALTVECAGDRYAVPQASVQQLVFLDAGKAADAVEEVDGAPAHRLRGELLPLVRLADVLGVTSGRHDGHVIIAVLRSEGRRFGLVVDRVVDTEEIVVRPVGNQVEGIGLYSGATVLGNGTVALVLDVQALSRRAVRPGTTGRQESRQAPWHVPAAGAGRRRRLLAAIGGGRRVAIPLDTITGLEQVRAESAERVGDREMVRFRGTMLPLVRLDQHLGGTDREILEVVVHVDHGRTVAIVVEQILDIVDGAAAVRSDVDDGRLPGPAVPGVGVTELLDVRAAILAADPAFIAAPPTPDTATPAGCPLLT